MKRAAPSLKSDKRHYYDVNDIIDLQSQYWKNICLWHSIRHTGISYKGRWISRVINRMKNKWVLWNKSMPWAGSNLNYTRTILFLSDDTKAIIYHRDYNVLKCCITAVQELCYVWLPHSNIAILINIWGAAEQFNSSSHLIHSLLKIELLVSCMDHWLPPYLDG